MNQPVRCVSDACRKKIDPSWSFCPYCGHDNRPPSDQDEIGPHKHQFLQGLGYCLICGEAHDEPYNMSGRSRVRWATVLLCISLVLWFVLFNIQMAGMGKQVLFGSWIRSWYDNPVTHHRRHRSYTVPLGRDVSMYTGIAAFGALFLSAAMFTKHRFNNGNAYWQYDDEKPWYRRRNLWW